MYFERTPRRTRAIQLTSLIDVMFLLVVFFMHSTTFIRIDAMELGLPGKNGAGASVSRAPKGEAPLIVNIRGDGGIYWEGTLIMPTTLRVRLEEAFKKNPRHKLLVRSGTGVTVQKLVSVLDIAYLAGVSDVSVDKWEEEASAPVPVSEKAIEAEKKSAADALEKAIIEEDENTPVLTPEDVPVLPDGAFSPQEQFDDMIEKGLQ